MLKKHTANDDQTNKTLIPQSVINKISYVQHRLVKTSYYSYFIFNFHKQKRKFHFFSLIKCVVFNFPRIVHIRKSISYISLKV